MSTAAAVGGLLRYTAASCDCIFNYCLPTNWKKSLHKIYSVDFAANKIDVAFNNIELLRNHFRRWQWFTMVGRLQRVRLQLSHTVHVKSLQKRALRWWASSLRARKSFQSLCIDVVKQLHRSDYRTTVAHFSGQLRPETIGLICAIQLRHTQLRRKYFNAWRKQRAAFVA